MPTIYKYDTDHLEGDIKIVFDKLINCCLTYISNSFMSSSIVHHQKSHSKPFYLELDDDRNNTAIKEKNDCIVMSIKFTLMYCRLLFWWLLNTHIHSIATSIFGDAKVNYSKFVCWVVLWFCDNAIIMKEWRWNGLDVGWNRTWAGYCFGVSNNKYSQLRWKWWFNKIFDNLV